MPDTQFSPLGTVTAPADWRLPPSLELVLKAAQATYDGTGAGGSFQPALQIVSDSGHSVGIYTCDTTILAGSSCEVSFFPFSPSSAGGAGTGIQFDVDNEGGGLAVRTNAPSVFGFYGTDLRDTSNGINIESEGNGAVLVGADGSGTVNLYATSGDLTLGTNSGGFDLTVGTLGNGMILDNNSSGDTVITADGATANLHLRANDTLDITVASGGSGFLTLNNLPVVNPGGSGRVWNNGGVLNIT